MQAHLFFPVEASKPVKKKKKKEENKKSSSQHRLQPRESASFQSCLVTSRCATSHPAQWRTLRDLLALSCRVLCISSTSEMNPTWPLTRWQLQLHLGMIINEYVWVPRCENVISFSVTDFQSFILQTFKEHATVKQCSERKKKKKNIRRKWKLGYAVYFCAFYSLVKTNFCVLLWLCFLLSSFKWACFFFS